MDMLGAAAGGSTCRSEGGLDALEDTALAVGVVNGGVRLAHGAEQFEAGTVGFADVFVDWHRPLFAGLAGRASGDLTAGPESGTL
jgi:hypothetical protein